MHFANKLCGKVQQKYKSNFRLSTETVILKYLEVWSHVLFSLLDYYWLTILVFPISTTKMKVNSSSAIWSSFIFSQMLLFKAYHTAWRKALYPKIHHHDDRVAISHALLKQEWLLSLIGRKMSLFVLKALMFWIWQEKLPEPICSQLSNR